MIPSGYTREDSFIDRLLERRWTFLVVFASVFFVSYLFLVAIDFVPEPVAKQINTEINQENKPSMDETSLEDSVTPVEPAEPVSIYIKRLDKDITVLNPASREVADLDNALLSGVVRHPDSAKLGQQGNVFILGHSSYLPTVLNKNFQAFNGIQDLEWGDEIEVSSADSVFVYRVDKVYRAEAGELVVPIAGEENRLTLATCDSFGTVTARFIVEATQVGARPL